MTIICGDSYREPIVGCNSHCTLDNKNDITCWRKNLDFFEKILVGQFRNYISTQAKIYTIESDPNFDIFINQSINSMDAVKRSGYEDEHKVINKNVITSVVKILMEDVKKLTSNKNFLNDTSLPLDTICPNGCEVNYNLYFVLSIISIVFNVIFVISYFILINIKEKLDLIEYNEKEYVISQ
uniref:Col_cuticle_N domain-containing protein n=1 Tax=Strongyloides stercoralis TaxID=6248 RepID=A0A0K0DU71_STRER